VTREEYEFKLTTFNRLLELGPQVWRNWDTVRGRMMLAFDRIGGAKDTALAAIRYRGVGQPQAIGRVITRAMGAYEFLTEPELMRYSGDALDKILLHELVHLGYPGHREDFKRVCKEVGGVLYGAAATSSEVRLEKRQPNGRYKPVKTFATEAEAVAYFKDPEQVLLRKQEHEEWLAADPTRTKKDAYAALRWRIAAG